MNNLWIKAVGFTLRSGIMSRPPTSNTGRPFYACPSNKGWLLISVQKINPKTYRHGIILKWDIWSYSTCFLVVPHAELASDFQFGSFSWTDQSIKPRICARKYLCFAGWSILPYMCIYIYVMYIMYKYIYIYTITVCMAKTNYLLAYSTLLNQGLSSHASVVLAMDTTTPGFSSPSLGLTCLSSAGMYLNVDRVPGALKTPNSS